MIMLTRLNGEEFMVNADLIEFIEITPDTVITMNSGKKILVTETLETVQERVILYKKSIHNGVCNKEELEYLVEPQMNFDV